jgi:hypothetical protein
MEIGAPHGSIRSLKDFGVHLGTVILGILIALGLEQWLESHHRSKMAAEAEAGFRGEMQFAIEQVKSVTDKIPGTRSDIEAQIAKLSAPAAQGAPDEPIKYPLLAYQLVPSASWDTAIATQVLGTLPYNTVRKYEVVYAELKVFVDAERDGAGYWYDLHKYGVSLAALTTDQRRALIEQLRRYDAFENFLEGLGQDTLKNCEAALK